jgi:hypothetical protein
VWRGLSAAAGYEASSRASSPVTSSNARHTFDSDAAGSWGTNPA